MSIKGIAPGRAYRAYRFPARTGGRLSRRVSAVRPVGYFASDLPAASDLATVPIPLTTHIYDRSGEHLLYTLSDERRDLISIDAVPKRMQDATIAIEDKSFWTNPGVDVGG